MSIIASAPVPAGSRLIDADTVNLTTPAVGRFPVNSPYRAQEPTSRARQAWEAVQTRDEATVAQLAATLGVPVTEVYDLAVDHAAAQTGWTVGDGRRPVEESGNPQLCPDWCPGTCGTEAERSHVRPIVDMTARHGDLVTEQVEIRAQLQVFESPHLPGGVEPAEVWMQLYGPTDGVSVALTPEQAEQLGRALLDAAAAAGQARA